MFLFLNLKKVKLRSDNRIKNNTFDASLIKI